MANVTKGAGANQLPYEYKSEYLKNYRAKQNAGQTTMPANNSGYEYKSSYLQQYRERQKQQAQESAQMAELEAQLQAEAEAPRRATLKDLTLGSVGRGYATSRYGNERYDEIMLGTQRQAKQAQKAKEKTEQEKYNFAAQSKAGQVISGAGELIGQQIYNFTNRDTLAAVGANVAGAAAVGAAVPLPEEIVTMPTAVARGLKLGTAATMYQISAAQVYDEMIEAGVSEKTAKTVANVIGAGMGALEGVQADELLKSAKILKGVKGEASEKALANIMKALGKLGVSTAIETGEEVAQEAVSMVGQDYAKRKEGIKTFTPEEYGQRLKDTAVQSALSFGLLGGVGAVGGAMMNRNNVNAQTNDANSANNEAENTPKRAINSKEDGTDTNVATTQPEIAPETAVANETAKDSRQSATQQNGANPLSAERYGEEGKKAFAVVQNDATKSAEFDAYYREGVMNKAMPKVEGVLTEAEATSAYNAGKMDGEANRTAYAQKQYAVSQNAGLNKESAKNLSMGDQIVYNTLGKAFGKEVVVVPTIKNADGTQSNAKIDLANGRIYIAEDAQNGGRVALAHEIIHDMRVAAPAEFDNLAKLVNDYHKRFNSYNKKLNETAKLYELDKGKIDYYDMMEEMVADFIADNKGAERIVDMLSTDKPLAQKFIDSVKKVVVKLGKLALDKNTRKIVNEWEDLVKQLENAVKATEQRVKDEADRIYKKATESNKITAEDAERLSKQLAEDDGTRFVLDESTGAVYIRESRKSYNESVENGKLELIRQLYLKNKGVSKDDADKYIESLEDIANYIAMNSNNLDYEADRDFEYLKSNSDYGFTADSSSNCIRRKTFQDTLDAVLKVMKDNGLTRTFTKDDYMMLRRMLVMNNYKAGCGVCYVDGARMMFGEMTDKLFKKHPELKGKYSYYDFMTQEGQVKLRKENPELLNEFIKINGSQNRPMPFEARTDYRNELYDMFTDSKGEILEKKVKTVNDHGGFRVQSFSDFELVNALDLMQVIFDAGSVGLKGQSYSKVISFFKLVNGTNLMANISVFGKGKGVDENGNLIFDNVQGVPIEIAKEIRNMNDKQFGTCLVGNTLEHIIAAMKADYIDYIIPFHRSQIKTKDFAKLDIQGNDDFTNIQLEKVKDPNTGRWRNPKTAEEKALIPVVDDWWDYNATPEQNARNYLNLCNERGIKPKFIGSIGSKAKGTQKNVNLAYETDDNTVLYSDELPIREGYVKLLVDFRRYDNNGKAIEQKPVEPNFNVDVIKEMLSTYKYEGSPTDANYKNEAVSEIVDEFISKFADKKPTEADILNYKGEYNELTSIRNYNEDATADVERLYGDVRYSISPTFEKEYDTWSKKYPNTNRALIVGETSEVLKSIGVKNNVIKWDTKKIRKIKNDHQEMTDAIIKQVPNVLEEPIIVMESKGISSRLTIYGDLYGANNLPVLAVLELEPNEIDGSYSLDTIKLVNAYTKLPHSKNVNPNTEAQKLINSSKILYVEPNKNKTFAWLKANRLQLPSAAKFGLNAKITYSADYVKAENEANTRESKMSEPEIPEGYKERGFAESTRTKSTQADEVKQDFIDNPDFYKQLANKTTREKAEAILAKGLSFAEAEFPKLLERMDAVAVPLADMMAKEYSKMGEHDKASNVIREAGQRLTKAGQFSQAAAIMLLKHNPMAALAYAQRDIDKLNVDGKKRFGSKWKDFELTDAETEMFKNIKEGDAEGIKKAYETINKRLAKEYPSTIWQKFIEASRISMLLNPRTNVKNAVSNLLLYPVTRGSGILSSGLQKAYSYYNKDYKPNQSGLLKKEIRTQAEKVWDDIKDTLETANKYNEGIKANGRDIQVFKEGIGTRVMENIAPGTLHKLNTLMGKEDAGLMETMRNATYWFLEVGDNIFVKQNFISRFGSYMQAKGITDINSMSEEDMAAAVEVAYREALRATFKDDTALSKWLANIKHTGNPYIDALMEMIMPFTKTPANIAMRGIDYSPVGIINTISKARKGADASEVIDELSKNLLGSALIAFGAWLFSKGIVTGGEPEDEEKAAFLKQQGWLPYAVKAGDTYVTYDWAQPAAIPVIMGVTIMESLEEGRLGVVDAVKNAGVASFNQWIELSPLQSLQEVMGGYGTVGENLLNTAIEMPQRLIPSALGATARTADTTQRITYNKGNVLQTQKDIAKSKVPGLSQTLPAARDTWGNEKKRDGSTLSAMFNQYINPSSTKKRNQTEVDLEIDRLYESVGDNAVYPRKAEYTIKKDGKTYQLSNTEYSEYQRIMGQLSYDSVKALMATDAYNGLTDYEKSKIIQKIYDNAFETAKYAIMEGQGYKKTDKDIKDLQETKIKKVYMDYNADNIAEYYIAHQILNNAESDKTASGVTIAGSKKKNGINRLVELGYTRGEAKRLYERMNGD